MEITIGSLVKSLAGHDKDEVFFILKEEVEYVYLVDGKYRTLDKPKKKNRKQKKDGQVKIIQITGGLKLKLEKIRQSILGRIWITNGIDNKQVHIEEFEHQYKKLGYKRGRTSKHTNS